MAEDRDQRTEQATPRRREEARERGEAARSPDLSGSVLLFVAFAAMYLLGPWLAAQLQGLFVQPLSRVGDLDISAQTINAQLTSGAGAMALVLAPLLGAIFIGGLAISVAQVGFKFSSQPFVPDLTRLDPVRGFGRMFSMRAFAKLLGGLMKMSVISLVLFFAIRADIPTLVGLLKNFSTQGNGVPRIAAFLAEESIVLGLYASLTLVLLGAADYAFQRWQYSRDLMMTKQEVKDEVRNMEGDPQLKKRRLEIQRKIAKNRMLKDAAEADVMVINPTHYTVALRYGKDDAAPRVVAKGADNLALRLREIARENDIPLVERPELARGLYRWVEIGEPVPQKFWKAAAEVLAFIWGRDEARRRELLEEIGV